MLEPLCAWYLLSENIPMGHVFLWSLVPGILVICLLVFGLAGGLSDRFGRLPVLLCGWSCRILLLLSLAWSCSTFHPILVWPLFLAYAASLAATEGAERALIGDFARQEERATAFGLYHMVVGLAVLPGALLFGAIWQVLGPAAAFVLNAVLSTGAVMLLQRQYHHR